MVHRIIFFLSALDIVEEKGTCKPPLGVRGGRCNEHIMLQYGSIDSDRSIVLLPN